MLHYLQSPLMYIMSCHLHHNAMKYKLSLFYRWGQSRGHRVREAQTEISASGSSFPALLQGRSGLGQPPIGLRAFPRIFPTWSSSVPSNLLESLPSVQLAASLTNCHGSFQQTYSIPPTPLPLEHQESPILGAEAWTYSWMMRNKVKGGGKWLAEGGSLDEVPKCGDGASEVGRLSGEGLSRPRGHCTESPKLVPT